LIISGWTLRYSNNIKKALSEILRVTKSGGLISIGFTYAKNNEESYDSKTNKTEENILYSTSQLKEFFKENIRNIYFEFDAFKDNPNISRASIIILRIKK
jgi:ubiquinone/menaquinone biosynthesis C-methylase UbiE